MDNCIFCGKQFENKSNPNWKRTKTCSDSCRSKYNSRRNVEKRKELNLGSRLGLSGGKIGKINQYVVAIDLLKRGYEVYTAFEDTHPFDILALKNNRTVRIEVKTANILPSGTTIFAGRKKVEAHPEKFDVLALVTNLSEIEYRGAI